MVEKNTTFKSSWKPNLAEKLPRKLKKRLRKAINDIWATNGPFYIVRHYHCVDWL